jgi:four helix bundle protein
MGTYVFRDLAAYRLAAELAGEVYEVVATWPSFDRWSLGMQLVRGVDSIGANIAEGVGRGHEADKRRFFFIARGSLYEVEHWLDLAEARGLTDGALEKRIPEIARSLSGLIRSSGNR